MRRIPILTVFALTAICACAAHAPRTDLPPEPVSTVVTAPPPISAVVPARSVDIPRRALALPRGWDSLTTPAFEDVLDRWNPSREPGRLDDAALDELRAALEGQSPRSLRAVLLLSASGALEAHEVLRARLERRIRTADTDVPAVDVAAAAALGKVLDSTPTLGSALEELAIGRRPHPTFAVRVECAVSCLALGRDGGIVDFLLAVLLEGTSDTRRRPASARGAATIDEMVFAQWRAATALARRAEIDNPYRPEASAVDRVRAAGELERALSARTIGGSRP